MKNSKKCLQISTVWFLLLKAERQVLATYLGNTAELWELRIPHTILSQYGAHGQDLHFPAELPLQTGNCFACVFATHFQLSLCSLEKAGFSFLATSGNPHSFSEISCINFSMFTPRDMSR